MGQPAHSDFLAFYGSETVIAFNDETECKRDTTVALAVSPDWISWSPA